MAAPIHSNITILDPDIDPARVRAMVAANTIGRDLNNEAVIASRAGDFALALSKHLEALPLKTRAFGEASVQAAITFNGLGETYLRLGDLELAGKMLGKALHVRNEVRLGGLGLGPALDAAVSRDNLGRVLEAAGRMGDARVARLAGNLVGSVLCGNFKVSACLALREDARLILSWCVWNLT